VVGNRRLLKEIRGRLLIWCSFGDMVKKDRKLVVADDLLRMSLGLSFEKDNEGALKIVYCLDLAWLR